jgi:transcription antitermination protein NusB
MGSRRNGREMALQTLYGIEFGRRDWEDAVGDMHDRAVEPETDDEDLLMMVRGDAEAREFAEGIVAGVMEHLEAIDTLLEECSTNWKVVRMARVDRNLLRLATFELRYRDDIPERVTINEAVEIAKQYGEKDSGSFINGILDKIASLGPA